MKKAPPKKAPKGPKGPGRTKLKGEVSTFGTGGMVGTGSKGKKCREDDGSPCKGPGSNQKKEGGTDYALLGTEI